MMLADDEAPCNARRVSNEQGGMAARDGQPQPAHLRASSWAAALSRLHVTCDRNHAGCQAPARCPPHGSAAQHVLAHRTRLAHAPRGSLAATRARRRADTASSPCPSGSPATRCGPARTGKRRRARQPHAAQRRHRAAACARAWASASSTRCMNTSWQSYASCGNSTLMLRPLTVSAYDGIHAGWSVHSGKRLSSFHAAARTEQQSKGWQV